MPQLHTREEQHTETGCEQHGRRTEIRFEQQQRGRGKQQAERLQKTFELVLQLTLLANDVTREIREHQHAR